MNIHAVSKAAIVCARSLDDRRLNKMITETAQIVCTALFLRKLAPLDELPFKPFNPAHPVNAWAANDLRHLAWAYGYFWCLARERVNRGLDGRPHKSVLKMHRLSKRLARKLTEVSTQEGRLKFANCAANATHRVNFKHLDNVHDAYRLYMRARWQIENQAQDYRPCFTNRAPPAWAKGYVHFDTRHADPAVQRQLEREYRHVSITTIDRGLVFTLGDTFQRGKSRRLDSTR